jgi:hypothetical protein
MQLHAQRFPLALGSKHFILMAYATSNSHPLFSCITTFADHTHGNGVRLINILCLLSRHLQRFLISICIMNQRACVLATYKVCYAICKLFCLVTCCPAELQSLTNNHTHITQEYDMYLQQYYKHVLLLKAMLAIRAANYLQISRFSSSFLHLAGWSCHSCFFVFRYCLFAVS